MKRIALGVVFALLALLPAAKDADASQPFQPVYDLTDVTLPTNGNVVQQITVPQGDHVIGFLKYTLPLDWDIAKVQGGQDRPIVGSGQLQIDVDQSGSGGLPCDGIPETYSLTIFDEGKIQGDPAEVETNWFVIGYQFEQFTFKIKGGGASSQTIEAFLFTAPTPPVCTLLSLDLTFQGTSSDNPSTTQNEAGRTVLTPPSATGVYTWSVEFHSKPLTFPPQHLVIRCDEIGIGTTAVDTDSDGITDGCDNCPSTGNADQRDFDLDGVGDACDPDADEDGVCDVGGPLPDGTPGTPPGGCAAGLAGSDLCPGTAGTPLDVNGCSQAQVDPDLDGICDPGSSSPTFCTGSDNCPSIFNPDQDDWNENGIGDACDDSDGDSMMDSIDNCRLDYNPSQIDGDLDGLGNECDPCPSNPDCDSDTVSDGPTDPDGGGPITEGPDNCVLTANTNQLDSDADGPGDVCDNCPSTANADQDDIDSDGQGDACDPDDFDSDDFSDRVEYSVGTDVAAAFSSGPSHSAHPADPTNDNVSDIDDIIEVAGAFGQSAPPACACLNIAPDPVDGFVDITDIVRVAGFFGQTFGP